MTITINGTTGIAGVDGSSSVPAFKGNDADTGIFYPTANEVAASAGGTVVWNASSTFGFKNRIINGAMVIDQRNAGAAVVATGTNNFPVDRFNIGFIQTNKFTAQQNAGSVTPPVGFTNYLGITSSSAYPVLTGDAFLIDQRIEGFNFADMAWGTASAATITLSFWVRSSLTGTFGGCLSNAAVNRSYPFSYTISAANTWEQKSVTIAGDTTGTWVGATNGVGVIVRFGLGSGATFSGTAGAWQAGNLVQPTGTVSVVGTNGATWYITGVQLEKGTQATSFEYRQYQQELALCQRYFCKSSSTNVVAVNNSSHLSTGMFSSGVLGGYQSGFAYGQYIEYPVTMRTEATTVTFINTSLPAPGTSGNWSIYSGGTWVNSTVTAPVTTTATGFGTAITFSSGTGYMYYGAWTASAEL